jgi:acetyl-CoA carboxylase biotin carboxylase subunit
LVIWGANRPECIARARRALSELSISGIKTTASLHKAILDVPAFIDGDVQTDFLEKWFNGI